MDTITTQPDTGLDWTDQVRAVAQFIGDRGLPLISLDAVPQPAQNHDGANVHVHIRSSDWITSWWPALERIIDEHTEQYQHLPESDFHYVVAIVAGVRVQLLFITDAVAVA